MEAITSKLFPVLQKIRSKLDGAHVNLSGDRDIECSWVASQMPSGPGKALDFGCGSSYLALIAARKGFDVTAIDLQAIQVPYTYPKYRFIQGDILSNLPKGTFSLIINCSAIEHVGLAGRYGVVKNEIEADLTTMKKLEELMKAGGLMLLTIPVGQDAVFSPLHRVYGKRRLPALLDGYFVEKKEFWTKDYSNRWKLCDEQTALDFRAEFNSHRKVYALGLYVLRKT